MKMKMQQKLNENEKQSACAWCACCLGATHQTTHSPHHTTRISRTHHVQAACCALYPPDPPTAARTNPSRSGSGLCLSSSSPLYNGPRLRSCHLLAKAPDQSRAQATLLQPGAPSPSAEPWATA
jgi:hypothetical protein